MRKNFMSGYAIILCVLILSQPSTVSAADKTKVWIGTGLIVGGLGLGAHAASNAFCGGFDVFPPTDERENNGCHQEAEMIAGVALIGAGTVVLIMGIRDDDGQSGLTKTPINPQNQTISLGFGPHKKGWAGSVRIRW